MGTLDGPIALAQPALPFEELAVLRDQSREIAASSIPSLKGYRDDVTGGYFHVLARDATTPRKPYGNEAGLPSMASSATVVPFLIRSGRWGESLDGFDSRLAAQGLLGTIVVDEPWTSAGLGDDNPFTVAFLLELVATLCDAGAVMEAGQVEICRAKLATLVGELEKGKGRVSIAGEVSNSYLTELAARVLTDWSRRSVGGIDGLIGLELELAIWDGAINAVNAQLALLGQEHRGGADVFELGYGVLLALQFPGERLRPELRTLLRRALAAFFSAQDSDGGWPRSRRLFQYPAFGDAYCYEFEFLARLLRVLSTGDDSNRKALLPYLDHLQRSVSRLTSEAVGLPHGGYGWSSGHHRAFVYPESWSTASCFDVCDQIDRLVTDTVTTTVLQHLEQSRLATDQRPTEQPFDKLLDSMIRPRDRDPVSLKTVLRKRLLEPIVDQAKPLNEGKSLAEGIAVSAILYGPPGTSKTTYARAVSSFLGWNLITVDPSHLLRSGFDNIHLEINTLFRMLGYAERVVVFFDEIDELVRDRSAESGEAVSRFLTTSMLPRIVKLRESRRLVFLVATNHIENFDPAFARPGRFDLVVPLMPPTAVDKFNKWPELADATLRLGIKKKGKEIAEIESLTFDELLSVKDRLAAALKREEFEGVLAEAARSGILNQEVRKGQTWAELMDEQRDRIRLGA